MLSTPTRFIESFEKKASRIENHLINTSERALKQLSKQESRLQKKLRKKDPLLAKQLFGQSVAKYQSLQSDLTNKASKFTGRADYIPFLDTITTAIRFLQHYKALAHNSMIHQSLEQLNSMQHRFEQSKSIQQYLYSRQQYLKERLGKLNMIKELKQYDKKLYYYQAQIAVYKDLLKQPDKLERKVIDLLSKTNPFQDFMARYSILGSLFTGSSYNTNTPALPGLQSSAQVNSLIQQTTGANNLQALQSNLQQAEPQIQQLKNKINIMGRGADGELPNFRPNQQRVKSFWNRWELGTNLQSTPGNAWLPSATQTGLSAGYKLNDRSVIGVGIAGNIGWSKSVRHIVVSYEGLGARSFVDWKLKGSCWLSAGYEMNYRSAFTRIEQLNRLNKWQQSGLVGISKKYQVSKKLKGSLSLLWDYLSYSQLPRTQPLVFRYGYNIK
ncbi:MULTISPECIES: hypothetical protein [Niastella]|uniref:Autotransporter domain-containing protein n=1 Tax=Niastella soli TaxID=2821487 RepID=A0ABS3Z5J2_9BACT|nr:hypothetical protein [Niastella soli]MBO9205412.1 hypothetical protein [Niastella soli]